MNQPSSMWKLLLSVSAAVLLMAASCPPSPTDQVVITFDQIGACNGYQATTGPGGSGPHTTVSAGANGAFVAFRIHTLDNSGSSRPFQFDPERIYIAGSSPREHVSSSLSLARDHGQVAVAPVTVSASTSQGNSGIAVVRVSTVEANPAAEASRTSYHFSYEGAPGDQAVFLSKRDAQRTTWPLTDNCQAIGF